MSAKVVHVDFKNKKVLFTSSDSPKTLRQILEAGTKLPAILRSKRWVNEDIILFQENGSYWLQYEDRVTFRVDGMLDQGGEFWVQKAGVK